MESLLEAVKIALAIFGGVTLFVIVVCVEDAYRKSRKTKRDFEESEKEALELEALHDEIDSNYGLIRCKANAMTAMDRAVKADYRCDNIDRMINAMIAKIHTMEAGNDERFNALLEAMERMDAKLPKAKGKK